MLEDAYEYAHLFLLIQTNWNDGTLWARTGGCTTCRKLHTRTGVFSKSKESGYIHDIQQSIYNLWYEYIYLQ